MYNQNLLRNLRKSFLISSFDGTSGYLAINCLPSVLTRTDLASFVIRIKINSFGVPRSFVNSLITTLPSLLITSYPKNSFLARSNNKFRSDAFVFLSEINFSFGFSGFLKFLETKNTMTNTEIITNKFSTFLSQFRFGEF